MSPDNPLMQPGAEMPQGWIGVDLDGTLAEYHGWVGIHHIGEPVEPMLSRVKCWLGAGLEVRIFTARACTPEAIPYIEAWLEEHLGCVLPVTNVKDYFMDELWDDRACQVHFNQGHPVAFSPRGLD